MSKIKAPEQEVILAVDFELAQVRKVDRTLVSEPVHRRYFFVLSKQEAEKTFLVSEIFKKVAVNKRETELKFEYEVDGKEFVLMDADWCIEVVSWKALIDKPQPFKSF